MAKTISDIAKITGVAKSTVSRYLNGGSVSEATRRKIESVIKETGYVPNTFAQSLKAKKTNMIGTIVPRLDSYAASQTLIGIDERLRDYGCQMLISNTSQSLEREIESLYSLERQKVAGIILLATQITDEHLKAFEEIHIPVLLVGQQHEQVYSIIHNDEQAAYDMGQYVLAKGHRDLVFIGVTELDIAVGVKRKKGFQRAVVEHGGASVSYYETGFTIKEALETASTIMEKHTPSIFVCATDNIALGVLKAAYMKGLRVPEDLSITGFGGYEVTEMIHPSLTTARFHYKEAGQLAAQSIMKLVNEEELAKVMLSKYEIIERESVDKR